METHVEGFTKRPEEVGDELRTSVRGYVCRNTVLGEDINEEELSEVGGRYGVMGGDEYGLLRQSVDDYKYGGESGGQRKLFYEIHGY